MFSKQQNGHMTFSRITSNHLANTKAASRDSGQLAKSTAGSCPACPLSSSCLPDSFHHPPPSQMPHPLAGCLICCSSELCVSGWLVESVEPALQLPRCTGTHLVFEICSRESGQNGLLTFARDSRLLIFTSNVKQTKDSTTQDCL